MSGVRIPPGVPCLTKDQQPATDVCDARHADPRMSPGTRRVIIIATMFLIGLTMLIGYSGIWDRALSADTKTLRVSLGAFDGLLLVEVQPHWGNYRVLVG